MQYGCKYIISGLVGCHRLYKSIGRVRFQHAINTIRFISSFRVRVLLCFFLLFFMRVCFKFLMNCFCNASVTISCQYLAVGWGARLWRKKNIGTQRKRGSRCRRQILSVGKLHSKARLWNSAENTIQTPSLPLLFWVVVFQF